jgi:GntR family transcriptional regulator, transcriptional repressor for pyruvate dehydrogenase complex
MKIFAPLANRTILSKSVEDAILEAIQSRKIESGAQLPSEMELCEQFGVSRTVVREALRALNSRGLITIIKGKGMFVRKFSGKDASDPLQFYLRMNYERNYVMDIVHARQILEPAVVALASKHRTQADIQRMADDLELLKTCADKFTELSRIDTQFHIDIAKSCGNSLMPLLLEPIHRLIPEIKSSVYATVKEARDSAVLWHQRILDGIIKGDSREARQAMVEHLKIAEDHAERMLKASSKYSKESPKS